MCESLHSDRGSIGLGVQPLDIGSQTVIYVLCLLFFSTFMFTIFLFNSVHSAYYNSVVLFSICVCGYLNAFVAFFSVLLRC